MGIVKEEREAKEVEGIIPIFWAMAAHNAVTVVEHSKREL